MRVDGGGCMPACIHYGISISIFRVVATILGRHDGDRPQNEVCPHLPYLPKRVLLGSCH